MIGNTFCGNDISGNPHIIILNGVNIVIAKNTLQKHGVSGRSTLIALGHESFIGSASDCDDTLIENNYFIGDGVTADLYGIEVDKMICTNMSKHLILRNIFKAVPSGNEVHYVAPLTNKNLVFEN